MPKPNPPRHLSTLPFSALDVVAHEAIAVQIEAFSFLQVGDGFQKRQKVPFALEDCLPIVATIDYVVNQAVGDGS
jgi:hypothetical protein